MSETRERGLVERVARAMMAVSRPNANPDDLSTHRAHVRRNDARWRSVGRHVRHE